MTVDGQLRVEDLGSRNGTFLEGERLCGAQATTLLPAVLHVGPFTLAVHPAAASPDHTLLMTPRHPASGGVGVGAPLVSLPPSTSLLERRLVALLEASFPHPMASADLALHLWGDAGWAPYMLYNLVSRCRRHLTAASGDITIVSVRGVGYRLDRVTGVTPLTLDTGIPGAPS